LHYYDELGNDVTLKIYHRELELKRKLEKLEKDTAELEKQVVMLEKENKRLKKN